MQKKGLTLLFLVIQDSILVVLGFVLSYYLRFYLLPAKEVVAVTPLHNYIGVFVFIVFVWLAIFKWFGIYEETRNVQLFDEIANLFLVVSLASLVLASLLFLYRGLWFSRQVIVYAWLVCFVLLSASRIVISLLQRWMYLNGMGVSKLLIVGADEIGRDLAARLAAKPQLGIRVVGFLDDDPVKAGKVFTDIPVLGKISKIKEVIRSQRVNEVVISSPDMSSAAVLDLITECEGLGVEFKLVPGFLEIMASRVDTGEIAGIPLVTIADVQWVGIKAAVKRAVDFTASGLLLIILSPLFLLIALVIKLDSRGPVFFEQIRVGKDGGLFTAYKFRSMVKDAEQQFQKIKHLSEVEGHVFKIKKDPRITRMGVFLRKFSLDELPQVINVFRGEMSLVGPRPPLPREVENYSSWHKKRLRISPGVTGLWQVSGRSEIPFEEMVRLDIYYIENWSLWLDCKIILRTIPAVLFGRGAY